MDKSYLAGSVSQFTGPTPTPATPPPAAQIAGAFVAAHDLCNAVQSFLDALAGPSAEADGRGPSASPVNGSGMIGELLLQSDEARREVSATAARLNRVRSQLGL